MLYNPTTRQSRNFPSSGLVIQGNVFHGFGYNPTYGRTIHSSTLNLSLSLSSLQGPLTIIPRIRLHLSSFS